MYRIHRFVVLAVGAVVLVTVSGCFLPFFGGGGEKQQKTPVKPTSSGSAAPGNSPSERSVSQNPAAAADAIRRAEQAITNKKYETAIIEYNRAIRADSSNSSTYFALAKLHRQLSEQYREAGKLDEALREHKRAVSVLSAYVTSQLEPTAAAARTSTRPGSADTTSATPSQTTPPPAKPDTAPPSSTQPTSSPPPR